MTRLSTTGETDRNSQARTTWFYEYTEFGQQGLNSSAEPGLLTEEQLSRATNIINDWELLRSEFGYVSVLTESYTPLEFSNVRRVYTYRSKTITSTLIFTNKFVYVLDSSLNILVPVQDTAPTKLVTEQGLVGSFLLKLSSSYAVGTYIVVEDNTGFRQANKVLEVLAGNIHRLELPLRNIVAVNSTVYSTKTFTATDDRQIIVATYSPTDSVYFTNGVDPPQFYNGFVVQTVQGLVDGSDVPITIACQTLASHYGYILLGNLTENGVRYPTRVRWCDIGSPDIWQWSYNYRDILESADHLVHLLPLNKYVIAYKESTIFRFEYVGSPELTWNVLKTIEDEGIFSPLSVAIVFNSHVFMGTKNVYAYDGEFALQPIGQPIVDNFIGPRASVNRPLINRAFSFYLLSRNEYWLFVPMVQAESFDSSWDDGTFWDDETGWDELPNTHYTNVFRYKIDKGAWTTRRYDYEVTAAGSSFVNRSMTWRDAKISWQAANFTWISTLVTGNEETPIFANGTDKNLLSLSFASGTDNGNAIPWQFETRDFYVSNNLLRFDRFDLKIGGDQAKLSYSKDGGKTWNVINIIPASDTLRRVRTYKQFTANRVRFRLQGSGYFQFSYLGFNWRYESMEGL